MLGFLCLLGWFGWDWLGGGGGDDDGGNDDGRRRHGGRAGWTFALLMGCFRGLVELGD